MKRKIIIMIVLAMISMGLMACGSKGSDLGEQKEKTTVTYADTQPQKDGVEKEEVISQSSDATILEEWEFEAEDTEIIEQIEVKPIWYMDSEGIKNDELGVVIKKDNGALKELGLRETVGIAKGTARFQQHIHCYYYEGDLDAYISEHSYMDMEKGKIRDFDYAYSENSNEMVLAGNGIIISAHPNDSTFLDENESISDYLNRIDLFKPYDESITDYLAYITEDGLYCPALGIKLACDEGENKIWRVGVSCKFADDYGYGLNIQDESMTAMGTMIYMVDTENAREVVDKYVENAIEPNEYITNEYSAIEDTVEINLGRCKYLGRGVIGQHNGSDRKHEDWLFYSDDVTWSITVGYYAGGKYEDYIGVIEDLE